ncbi:MAG TPA: ABC transporter permease [Legionellaceae bacterium]|nr:ABC transporter permease [Legionellaceae bacterium]
MTAAQLSFDASQNQYRCLGNWSILYLKDILEKLKANPLPHAQDIIINGKEIAHFDSAGALILTQCIDLLRQQQNHIELREFTSSQTDLLNLVSKKKANTKYIPIKRKKPNLFYEIGKETVHKIGQINGLLILIGDMTIKFLKLFRHQKRMQWASIFSNMASTGLLALPILAMLSFLIGVVLAYQMGLQLETYGASIFIAYLSGMAIFREFGPLITAIIVAGRTGSSFTAQIGSMKINEEIDALHTMGLSPTELLVIPKVIGLSVMFPLMIFWSDLFAVIGSMIMSKYKLNVGYSDFLMRLQDSVGFKQMMLGLYKAPAFSILIALVGCFQGFQVGHSADSVGSQTTRSVVQALFLIIVTDAAYSVIYSWQGL